MSKTTFSMGNLKIEYTGNEPADSGVTPVSLQKNLDSMITFINQILDALPDTEKVAFLKNDQYPDGTFVLVTSAGQTPIVPQYLLTRLQESVPKAYVLAQGSSWGWSIANPESNIDINSLITEFQNHIQACLNQYISEGDALNYKMDFTYKVVASVVNAPQITASSDQKFHFTVKAAK